MEGTKDTHAQTDFCMKILLCIFDDNVHGVYNLTGGLLSAFILLEQLFKVAPCRLVQDSAGTLSFSFCQTANDLKNLAGI